MRVEVRHWPARRWSLAVASDLPASCRPMHQISFMADEQLGAMTTHRFRFKFCFQF